MLEPLKLLDYVVLVIACPECQTEVRTTFTALVRGQELHCLGCDLGFQMSVIGQAMPQVEAAFQRVQTQFREQGCWVEVRVYP